MTSKVQERREITKEMFTACRNGDLPTLRSFFKSGKLGKEELKNALLYFRSWTLEVNRCLLELGADPNSIPSEIFNCNSLELLKLFSEFGLRVEEHGHNILSYCLDKPEMVDWLLDHGADPNRPLIPVLVSGLKKGEHDHTVAVLNAAAAQGNIHMFDHLVQRGADPTRSIALHRASRCEDPERSAAMVTHLIEKYGFDVNADDRCGGLRNVLVFEEAGQPLGHAISNENVGAVKALLDHGADPNYGLNMAIHREFLEGLELLLLAGADALAGFATASENEYSEAAELCVKYGADKTSQ